MAIPTREPFLAFLLTHAATLRRQRATAPAAAERLAAHAQALELLADVVQDLPEDDERLLLLETLAVRDGQFVPGAATGHALTQFARTSREACDAFLTTLYRSHGTTPSRGRVRTGIYHPNARAERRGGNPIPVDLQTKTS
jgi:hypothetical protein